MERLRALLRAVDEFQQRQRWLAFPVGVVKKFGDDQAGHHAALLLLFLVGFRVLTVRNVSLRSLLPGAALAALAWALLQWLGGWYVDRQLSRATNTYGTFALVIGLLSWLYLCPTSASRSASARPTAPRNAARTTPAPESWSWRSV